MTDRLEDLLAAGPPGEVDAAGLAPGARSRLRSRRQSRGAMAFAVVAVAAVPLVMALVDDAPNAVEPAPPTASTSVPVVEDGTRTETWHRISLQVPDSWGYRSGCPTLESGPDVGRPGLPDCGLRSGYGVTFGDGSAINWVYDSGHVWQYRWESEDQVKVYPEDAWLGLVRDGDDYAMVVTDSEALTRRIVDSAEVVEDVDANGCAVRQVDEPAHGSGEQWSVCHYELDRDLERSELLSVADTERFLDAIADAPVIKGFPECWDGGRIRVAAGTGGLDTVTFTERNPCFNGVHLSGTVRTMTPELWAWLR